MRIVELDDYYIDELAKHFPHVMFSKRFHRSHTRKYVGVVLSVNGLDYYVPFSSPKLKDYTHDGVIKSDNLFSASMVECDGSGNKRLLGTLRFNNMIPVPRRFVIEYSFSSEVDKKYADLIKSEWLWISKHKEYICNKAKKIYDFKINESKNRNQFNSKRYDCVLPFKAIEDYISNRWQ